VDLLILIFWLKYSFYYPKPPKEKIGVVVAITVKNLRDDELVKSDFLDPLRAEISSLNLPCKIIDLKSHQSERVKTKEEALRVLKNTKSQFCIWGSLKKRKDGSSRDKYIFSLSGMVVHKPVEEIKKNLLAKEFGDLLPSEAIFEKNFQFREFEFRVDQSVAALGYITGRAALLSGDIDIAIQLHESLLLGIRNGKNLPISVGAIENILSLEYNIKAGIELKKEGRPVENIDKALEIDPNNYGALLGKSIIEFDYGNGDVKQSLRTIRKAGSCANGDYTWKYNEAFILFWLGGYKDALRSCRVLNKKSFDGEDQVISDVISFTNKMVKKSNKPQLYYWLGFVSYKKSGRLSLADGYFQKLIDNADDSMDGLVERSKTYLSEIKKEINY
ncbi:tetratricopeptide repeat protein, partial [Patescibacteria group bacterium]